MKTEIFWIDGVPTGRLGIAPRPRGGDWLDDAVQDWLAAGVTCVVSALTPAEEAELALQDEATICRARGLQFVSLPIPDRGTPSAASIMDRALSLIIGSLKAGKSVLIHCRQGIGRASLIAASVLTAMGEDPERALSKIGLARGCPVPETEEQRVWVRQFAAGVRRADAGTLRSLQRTHRVHRRVALAKAHA